MKHQINTTSEFMEKNKATHTGDMNQQNSLSSSSQTMDRMATVQSPSNSLTLPSSQRYSFVYGPLTTTSTNTNAIPDQYAYIPIIHDSYILEQTMTNVLALHSIVS